MSGVGVSYQLRNNVGNVSIGSPVSGTGATISLPTGNLSVSTTFNILATNVSTGCDTQLTTTPVVSVDPLLSVVASTPDNLICEDQTTSVVGTPAGGTAGYSYLWSSVPASGALGLSFTNIANPVFTPPVTGVSGGICIHGYGDGQF